MSQKTLPIIDWLEINSSAPAKFIISGEYSVLYDKQAIAASIDLRTRVVIRPNSDGVVRLNLKNVRSSREWPTSELAGFRLVLKYSECLDYHASMPGKLHHLLHDKYYCATTSGDQDVTSKSIEPSPSTSTLSTYKDQQQSRATENPMPVLLCSERERVKKADDAAMAFLLLYIGLGDSYCCSARPSIDVEVESAIPVGSGLGSSSAYSVALCGALMRVFRVAAEKYIISNWAFNVDRYFHGRPSGVDNNIVTAGGYILFQQGKIKAHGVAHKAPIKVMLIDTCVSRSTKKICERVANFQREEPVTASVLFGGINDVTTTIWRKLNDPDFTPRTIAVNLKANQQYLNSLGVGHERLTAICQTAEQMSLTAKQTGAGGGGTAFVLYDDSDNCINVRRLRHWLLSENYRVHDYSIGCEGLIVRVVPESDKQADLGDS